MEHLVQVGLLVGLELREPLAQVVRRELRGQAEQVVRLVHMEALEHPAPTVRVAQAAHLEPMVPVVQMVLQVHREHLVQVELREQTARQAQMVRREHLV